MTQFDTQRLQMPQEVDSAGRYVASGMVERRRPGRARHVSQELIPLLRGEVDPVQRVEAFSGEGDQLGMMRGLAIGITLSAVMWVVLLRLVF